MKAKEIFEKIKKENLENEINLVKKINEGNENLKNTLQKIKKDMEKISIYSKVNYDFVPKKKNTEIGMTIIIFILFQLI